jgi:hypothetical protein
MTPLINHRLAGVEVEAAVAVEGPAEVVVAEAAVPAQVAAVVVEPARVVVAVVAPVLGSEPGSEPASVPVPVLVVGRPPAQTQSPR